MVSSADLDTTAAYLARSLLEHPHRPLLQRT
jgi:hypothetical protein